MAKTTTKRVRIAKNNEDNTNSLIEEGINRILTDFNNGGSDTFWLNKGVIVLYRDDYRHYPSASLDQALDEIKSAGYYVWKIVGFFGRNFANDVVYRITKVNVKPTPGCTAV